jgi:hypothetical protein
MRALHLVAALAALAAATSAGCHAAPPDARPGDPSAKGRDAMSTSQLPAAEPLSPDLVPFIGDRAARMVVASIAEVHLAPHEAEGVEAGPVTLEVIELLHGSAPHAGQRVAVPARRKIDRTARARSNFDAWNVLALAPGKQLLVALAPTDVPGVFRALAAQAITSPADPAVEAVRRDYAIEALPEDQRRAPIERALVSEERLDRFYALEGLENRGLLGRQAGAEAIAAAIAAPQPSPQGKLDLAGYLVRPAFFDKRREADPTNRLVIATVARALLADADPERRLAWAHLLASVVLPPLAPAPDVDRARKIALLRGAQLAFADVDRALADLLPHAEDDAERATIERLREAIRAAKP